MPSSMPTATPMAKPAIVVQNVCHACIAMGPAYWISERTMAIGAGKMNSDTSKSEHTTCHTTRMAAATSHGAKRSNRASAAAFMSGARDRSARASHGRCR